MLMVLVVVIGEVVVGEVGGKEGEGVEEEEGRRGEEMVERRDLVVAVVVIVVRGAVGEMAEAFVD